MMICIEFAGNGGRPVPVSGRGLITHIAYRITIIFGIVTRAVITSIYRLDQHLHFLQ